MQRIRRSLDHHLSFLKPVFREEIERLLICLQEAIDALELSVSLFPLVDEYPGTSYRYQFRKRLNTDQLWTDTSTLLLSLFG
jgi:hypothetical protein